MSFADRMCALEEKFAVGSLFLDIKKGREVELDFEIPAEAFDGVALVKA